MKLAIGRVIGSGVGIAICSLVAVSASGMCFTPQNALENPSFETGDAAGWSEANPIGGTIGAPTAGAHSGSSALEVTVAGGGAVPEGRQILPASAGDIWEMRGYMLTQPGLPAGASFGLLKIVFQDDCGADLLVQTIEIGGQNNDFPGVESTPFLDSTQPAGTWVESVAKGTAPAGTARVALLILNVDFAGGENPFGSTLLRSSKTTAQQMSWSTAISIRVTRRVGQAHLILHSLASHLALRRRRQLCHEAQWRWQYITRSNLSYLARRRSQPFWLHVD